MSRPSLLLVSDPSYPAQGRRYGDEDLWLATRLREAFDLALCSPLDAEALMDRFDLVLVRNSGAVIHYRDAYEAFRDAVRRRGTRVVNPVDGRADMAGKGYLAELHAAGEPVIPSVVGGDDLRLLPDASAYVVKPLDGADSIGLRIVAREALASADVAGMLVQPQVEIVEEVSFVFVGRDFSYALRTVSPERRWELEPFVPTAADLEFAQRFIDWNTLDVGVQRVDGCRTRAGELLLVELEDLNPYLSLDVIDVTARAAFVGALSAALMRHSRA